jgi:hypothetical protein
MRPKAPRCFQFSLPFGFTFRRGAYSKAPFIAILCGDPFGMVKGHITFVFYAIDSVRAR